MDIFEPLLLGKKPDSSHDVSERDRHAALAVSIRPIQETALRLGKFLKEVKVKEGWRGSLLSIYHNAIRIKWAVIFLIAMIMTFILGTGFLVHVFFEFLVTEGTRSRLTVVLLTPVCTVVAVLVEELWDLSVDCCRNPSLTWLGSVMLSCFHKGDPGSPPSWQMLVTIDAFVYIFLEGGPIVHGFISMIHPTGYVNVFFAWLSGWVQGSLWTAIITASLTFISHVLLLVSYSELGVRSHVSGLVLVQKHVRKALQINMIQPGMYMAEVDKFEEFFKLKQQVMRHVRIGLPSSREHIEEDLEHHACPGKRLKCCCFETVGATDLHLCNSPHLDDKIADIVKHDDVVTVLERASGSHWVRIERGWLPTLTVDGRRLFQSVGEGEESMDEEFAAPPSQGWRTRFRATLPMGFEHFKCRFVILDDDQLIHTKKVFMSLRGILPECLEDWLTCKDAQGNPVSILNASQKAHSFPINAAFCQPDGFFALCPRGHAMHLFATPCPGFTCDVCDSGAFPSATLMWCCARCDFDTCCNDTCCESFHFLMQCPDAVKGVSQQEQLRGALNRALHQDMERSVRSYQTGHLMIKSSQGYEIPLPFGHALLPDASFPLTVEVCAMPNWLDKCQRMITSGGMMYVLLLVALMVLRAVFTLTRMDVSSIGVALLTVCTLLCLTVGAKCIMPDIVGFPYHFTILIQCTLGYLLLLGTEANLEQAAASPLMVLNESHAALTSGVSRLSNMPPPYAVCQRRWGSNGATVSSLDLAELSRIAYDASSDASSNCPSASGLLNASFGDRARLHDCTALLDRPRWMTFYFPPSRHGQGSTGTYVVSIKGTSTVVDGYFDLELFSAIKLMQLAGNFLPIFDIMPDSAIASWLSWSDVLGKHFDLEVIQRLSNHVADIKSRGETVLLTGHSLGGGLAQLVASHHNLSALVFSAPGVDFSSGHFGMTTDAISRDITIVMPDMDLVPRVDLQLGVVQHINCLDVTGSKATAVSCHSMDRTTCELWRVCGDSAVPPRNFIGCLGESSDVEWELLDGNVVAVDEFAASRVTSGSQHAFKDEV